MGRENSRKRVERNIPKVLEVDCVKRLLTEAHNEYMRELDVTKPTDVNARYAGALGLADWLTSMLNSI